MLPRPLLELATDAFWIGIARVYGSSTQLLRERL